MEMFGSGSSSFKTTSWTMVVDAQRDPAALEAFVVAYWSPVYVYMRRAGRSADDALDLTQQFFATLLETPRVLEQANPDRGRFRTFLLKATKNFLIDEHRREHGRDGLKKKPLPMSRDVLQMIEPNPDDDLVQAFDRQWATTVLNEAITRLESSCRASEMTVQWSVFEQRVLRPLKQGNAPMPIEEMLSELPATTPQEVYSMVQTMKRRLHRELLAVVSETVNDPREAPGELAELLRVLAKPR